MYQFNKKVDTKKKSAWTNSCVWIVIHHTAWWTFESNMNYLSKSPAKASVHFVIWPEWECWKIWDPRDILWHAGNWSWGAMDNVNNWFLWIEVVWVWDFNIRQLIKLTDLVEYLMWVFNIEKNNIVRHSDVTQDRETTRAKIPRDGKRKVKKIDIWLDFFWDNVHFLKRRSQLKPRTDIYSY